MHVYGIYLKRPTPYWCGLTLFQPLHPPPPISLHKQAVPATREKKDSGEIRKTGTAEWGVGGMEANKDVVLGAFSSSLMTWMSEQWGHAKLFWSTKVWGGWTCICSQMPSKQVGEGGGGGFCQNPETGSLHSCSCVVKTSLGSHSIHWAQQKRRFHNSNIKYCL